MSYSLEWYFHPSAHLRVLHVPDGHPIKKGAVSAAAEVLISSFTASVSQSMAECEKREKGGRAAKFSWRICEVGWFPYSSEYRLFH